LFFGLCNESSDDTASNLGRLFHILDGEVLLVEKVEAMDVLSHHVHLAVLSLLQESHGHSYGIVPQRINLGNDELAWWLLAHQGITCGPWTVKWIVLQSLRVDSSEKGCYHNVQQGSMEEEVIDTQQN
jgi:hypothetical protein